MTCSIYGNGNSAPPSATRACSSSSCSFRWSIRWYTLSSIPTKLSTKCPLSWWMTHAPRWAANTCGKWTPVPKWASWATALIWKKPNWCWRTAGHTVLSTSPPPSATTLYAVSKRRSASSATWADCCITKPCWLPTPTCRLPWTQTSKWSEAPIPPTARTRLPPTR